MKIVLKQDIGILSKKYDILEKDILLIIANMIQKNYTEVFFLKDICFLDEQYDLLLENLARRSQSEPISKIIQEKEFYGICYKTNQYTLDPRPETELIVDLFQKYFPNKDQKLEILDLGCGTGCLGLSILTIYKNAICEFVDISKEALDVCISNAKTHNLTSRCEFTISNWFSDINGKFDVILSNPPYISDDYQLDKEVLYDPKIALFSGKDGLDSYTEIVPSLKYYLKERGVAILEIGYDQRERVLKLNTSLEEKEVVKDLMDHDRVIVFQYAL